jgi:hypothetical protein
LALSTAGCRVRQRTRQHGHGLAKRRTPSRRPRPPPAMPNASSGLETAVEPPGRPLASC